MSKSRMNGMGLLEVVEKEVEEGNTCWKPLLSNCLMRPLKLFPSTNAVSRSLVSDYDMIWINEGRPQKVKILEGRGKGIGFRYVLKSC